MLGAGWGTRVSVHAFRAAGWEVAALWSRRPERAAAEAARLEIPFATHDAAALFDRAEIDAVAIHTPPHLHLEMSRAAFAAGKHVLLDKPFATNVADARSLLAAAEASGRTAMINFEFRFAPLCLQVGSLVAEGAIGQLRHVSMDIQTTNPLLQLERPWRLDPALGGGLLNELGSHAIDRLRQWFGDLATVSARLASFPPEGLDPGLTSEDHISASFSFAAGGIATLAMSWVSDPPLGLRIVITGSEGVIRATSSGGMLTEGEVALGRRRRRWLHPRRDSRRSGSGRSGRCHRRVGPPDPGIRAGHRHGPLRVAKLRRWPALADRARRPTRVRSHRPHRRAAPRLAPSRHAPRPLFRSPRPFLLSPPRSGGRCHGVTEGGLPRVAAVVPRARPPLPSASPPASRGERGSDSFRGFSGASGLEPSATPALSALGTQKGNASARSHASSINRASRSWYPSSGRSQIQPIITSARISKNKREQLHRPLVEPAHRAIAGQQRSSDRFEPRLFQVAEQRHRQLVLMPAEARIIEIDHMQRARLADQNVVRMQVRVNQRIGPGVVTRSR